MITAWVLVLLIAAALRACYWLLTRSADADAAPDRSGPGRKPGPTTPNYSSRSTL